MTRPIALLCSTALTLLSLTAQAAEPKADAAPRPQLGNGEENRIVVEGMKHGGRTFTFPEVEIAKPGWLVLHPFGEGKPRGEIYVGATYLPAGVSRDVSIDVTTAPEPASGTMFLVMLHSDSNDDGTFDFFFVDERNVADVAVFEDSTMIAHVIQTP